MGAIGRNYNGNNLDYKKTAFFDQSWGQNHSRNKVKQIYFFMLIKR